jgi:hypothetical protein
MVSQALKQRERWAIRQSKNPSPRYRAWRNLCVAGINAGLAQGVFTLDSDGPERATYQFDIPERIGSFDHCRALVYDIGWQELRCAFAVNPSARVLDGRWSIDRRYHCFDDCDAWARVYLERRDGAWLQTAHGLDFACRKWMLPPLAAAVIEPNGFADHGRFIL